MDFCCRIKELRKRHKLTQAQLAEQLGLTERSYQRLEANDSKPMYDNLISLANYFHVSTDYLVGRTDCPDIVTKDKDGNFIVVEAMQPHK